MKNLEKVKKSKGFIPHNIGFLFFWYYLNMKRNFIPIICKILTGNSKMLKAFLGINLL